MAAVLLRGPCQAAPMHSSLGYFPLSSACCVGHVCSGMCFGHFCGCKGKQLRRLGGLYRPQGLDCGFNLQQGVSREEGSRPAASHG